ncbi:tubulin--tyrosine ligase-like protein 12 [Holotrichia oblita]|uniref:Tubulin--tyrosine ligase-like protein 12 n=1 Tax=Holotrichia oblita TaxID=644536 RepID=A0ACB9TKB8_HOLOL|nr:tubulin--tyrosine ligase-like protein 12 [Holotrichia oblita]
MVHATYETFLENHRNQLESSAIPPYFWSTLFQKIIKQTFDAGNIFSLLQIDYEDEERDKYDPVWQLQIKVEEGIKHTDPHHIYLIDHAWTFGLNMLRISCYKLKV